MSQDSLNKEPSQSPNDKPSRSVLTKRAVDASVSVASSYGISVDDPHVLAEVPKVAQPQLQSRHPFRGIV
jgi:hypothetical protein